MLTIAVLSSSPGCGKTTILINLGIGLQHKGFRVLLATGQADTIMLPWLNPIVHKVVGPGATLETTSLNVDLLIKHDSPPSTAYLIDLQNHYDYLLIDAGSYQAEVCPEVLSSDIIMVCIETGIKNNLIYDLERQLRHQSQGLRGIDIIVPSKARAGEWERNAEHLMTLIEYFGENKVADFIPFCEAIHDLPQEKKSVWDLPQQYSNRKQTFNHLVDTVLSLH